MTFLSVLADAGAADGPVVDNFPGWPAPLDATHAAIRPAGRFLATLRVGPGGFGSIGDAITEAKAIQLAATTFTEAPGPDHRVDIIIPAGTYEGANGVTEHISLIGETGNPDDVQLIATDDGAGGTLHVWGATYMEGITLVTADGTGGSTPKYPIHITQQGGTTILANCVLTDRTITGDTHALAGMDAGAGTDLILYRCNLKPGRASGTNLHGALNAADTATVTFAHVTSLDSPAGYGRLSDQADVVNWHGGEVSELGTNAILRISGDPVIGQIDADTVEYVDTWPVPTGGLSDRWRTYYYPSRIGDNWTLTTTQADTAPMTPVVGRTYYVPIPVTAAIRADRYGWTGALGPWAGTMLRTLEPATLTPATATATEAKHYYRFIYYPGQQYAWVALTFGAGAIPDGSVQMAHDLPCWYSDNGGDLTRIPAGEPCPIAHIRTA